MARTIKPLTATQVSKAKRYELSDGKGLMLRVNAGGSKTWLFKYYKPYTTKRSNLVLGAYPDMTLEGLEKNIKTLEPYLLVVSTLNKPKHKN